MSGPARDCAAAIRRAGGQCWLERGEESLPFQASIQPRRGEDGDWSDALGVGAAALYTLFAPLDGVEPAVGDCIRFRGSRYYLQRVETYCLGGDPCYHWGILRRESGGGERP